MEEKNKKEDNKSANALRYASWGTQMMVLLAIGVWGGLKLDEKMHTKPLFLIVFPLLALTFSLLQLYRQLTGRK
jgi:F0F1-type ATP synthase assembly protein I